VKIRARMSMSADLTPALGLGARLTHAGERAFPGGPVEIVYTLD
jgi:hypothetical protein